MTLGRVSATLRCLIATSNDAEKQQKFPQTSDYCRTRNDCLWTARLILIKEGAILNFLLSEADFFVDEKDLQTLSARLYRRAFFCPLHPFGHLIISLRTPRNRGRCPFRSGRDAPIFHHVMSRVHRGRQQVLPVIAVPDGIERQGGGRRRQQALSLEFFGLVGERRGETGRDAADKRKQHGNLPQSTAVNHHVMRFETEQPVKTLTKTHVLLHVGIIFLPRADNGKNAVITYSSI
jgi:hypothetical protein